VKVADLQQHLGDLGRLLETSGARGVAADLAAIRDGLTPFRDQSLKAFADFLIKAEALSRGGPLPAVSPPRTSRGAARAPAVELGPLTAEVKRVYDQAGDPAVTNDHIEAALAPLSGLTKAALEAIAEAVELKGMKSKTKDSILNSIRARILTRKGAAQRAGLIDRPAGQEPVVPASSG
jgi:hypothetical protein